MYLFGRNNPKPTWKLVWSDNEGSLGLPSLRTINEGRMEGKKTKGRLRMMLLDWMRKEDYSRESQKTWQIATLEARICLWRQRIRHMFGMNKYGRRSTIPGLNSLLVFLFRATCRSRPNWHSSVVEDLMTNGTPSYWSIGPLQRFFLGSSQKILCLSNSKAKRKRSSIFSIKRRQIGQLQFQLLLTLWFPLSIPLPLTLW